MRSNEERESTLRYFEGNLFILKKTCTFEGETDMGCHPFGVLGIYLKRAMLSYYFGKNTFWQQLHKAFHNKNAYSFKIEYRNGPNECGNHA